MVLASALPSTIIEIEGATIPGTSKYRLETEVASQKGAFPTLPITALLYQCSDFNLCNFKVWMYSMLRHDASLNVLYILCTMVGS